MASRTEISVLMRILLKARLQTHKNEYECKDPSKNTRTNRKVPEYEYEYLHFKPSEYEYKYKVMSTRRRRLQNYNLYTRV